MEGSERPEALPSPLPPEEDADADGILNDRDGCPSTPKRAEPVVDGCAAVEIVANAQRLIEPVAAAVELAADGVGARYLLGENAGPLAEQVRGAERAVVHGLELIERGSICDAVSALGEGANALGEAGRATGEVVLRRQDELLAQIEPGEGDADGKDVAAAELDYRLELVRRAERTARDLGEIGRELCGQVAGPRTFDGTILTTDDARGFVELRDGTLIVLADRFDMEVINEGVAVRIRGTAFVDGTGVGDGGTLLGEEEAPDTPDEVAPAQCMHLRVAPFQPFNPPVANVSAQSLVLHDPRGYTSGGRLRLEDLMRLGVVSSRCPQSDASTLNFVRHSLQIQWRKDGAIYWKTLAADLVPGEHPVQLPTGQSATHGELRIRQRVQNCLKTISQPPSPPTLTCSVPQTQVSQELPTTIYPWASLGSLSYESTVFSLEDWDTTSHDVGSVDFYGFESFLDPGPTKSYQAFGYSPLGTKTIVTVTAANPYFAVYQKDLYDAFAPDEDILFSNLLLESAVGTRQRASLIWPRIIGTRNGFPFWYAAELPDQLVRDRVEDCSVDSFYRLPWKAGTAIGVGQGNLTTGSHKNEAAYAYDFSLALNQKIRAARGGVVDFIRDWITTNWNPNENEEPPPNTNLAFGNYVRITHQDGTYAWYMHIKHYGVLVGEGWEIQRGQPIARTGNTGRSTGPHLHFQVQQSPTDGAQTMLAIFDGCYYPQTGDNPTSTNSNPNYP
jgi:hypothetical protein